ncbi:GAF domain-containing protein [Pedobacter gandavensis]|uniref:GAF domain-containing protein n=1 Tax=Pedobacter gandavensis TaxID=2679963 RepID=UPI00247A0922|nr:GAF domain-containing protein [Pedobacter gandavensis]WGQ10766.1 GAF domain-containing protein [Pedobacter gandavensis]
MENIFGRNIIPSNDSERVAALNRYHLINTVQEPVLDQIVQLTADTFDTPMALISLVDVNDVFFKASIGAPDLDSMPRGRSLCSIAILDTEPLIIHYAEKEKCLLSIPVVAGEFGFKFYASAPLITPDGFAIGALCITDTRAREFCPEQIESLKDLAGMIMQEIENRLPKLNIPTITKLKVEQA